MSSECRVWPWAVGLLGCLLVAGAAVAAGAVLAWNAGWQGRILDRAPGVGVLVLLGAFPTMELLLARYRRTDATGRWVWRIALAPVVLLVGMVASVVLSTRARNASVRESEQRGRIVVEALEHFRSRTGAYPATLDGLLTVDGKPLPLPSIDRNGWNYRVEDDGFRLMFSPGWIDWVEWHSERGAWEWH